MNYPTNALRPGDVTFNGPVGAGLLRANATQPSLEQRLQYLQVGLDRLNRLRARLEGIADSISMEKSGLPPAAPNNPPCDLSSRLGETIGYVHANIDSLETLVDRIDLAVFEPKPAAVCNGRADR